ncbi:MAG: hypothetical protein ACKOJF_06795, partial [Planctomycetaceae bacterium]
MVAGQPGQGKLTASRVPTAAHLPPGLGGPLARPLPPSLQFLLALVAISLLSHGLITPSAAQNPARPPAQSPAPLPSSPPATPPQATPPQAPSPTSGTPLSSQENPSPSWQRFALRPPPIDYFAPADNPLTRLASAVASGEIS